MARVEALGGRYLSLGQGLYPAFGAERQCAAAADRARRPMLLERPSVAMVGARNASAAACRFARGLAHDLGREGVVVVSGLARGIDAAAHEGGLESGTIGVIAGGLDNFYPPENERLQREMGERGLLLAEMPPAPNLGRGISRTATGSSPACARRRWWWKLRRARAR